MAKTLLRVSVALLSLVLAISIVVLVFSVLEYQARNPTVPTPPPIIINSETLTHHDEHPERPVQTFDENPVVYTEYGGLRGRKQFTLFENKSYYAFKGIPYAKPPLAELRFKVYDILWRFVFNSITIDFINSHRKGQPDGLVYVTHLSLAIIVCSVLLSVARTVSSLTCIHRVSYRFISIFNRLELNKSVQSSRIRNCAKKKLRKIIFFLNLEASNDVRFPVIVAIHGGAFTDTSADTLGPDFLLNQADVVVV